MKTIFELCHPRRDILAGSVKDSDFAADLAQVLNGTAPDEYSRPDIFFANTYPTHGLKTLLANVFQRLSGTGGAAAIFRLDTQYGGGKTHALIALAHGAKSMRKVPNAAEFLDLGLLPAGTVRVAAFDGENADPGNGRLLARDVRAFTPWGEIAFALAGRDGFDLVRRSDEQRMAPGADTLRQLFGGQPSLILLDELSIYLRKVRGRPDADQLAPFLTSLFKAVESSPGACLVFTLAIGKAGKATDAYAQENEFIGGKLDEAASIAARKATVLDPTAEHEVARVLRRRLFADIDDAGAVEVAETYHHLWAQHAGELPAERQGEDRVGELLRGYPLHPALMGVLTDKLSTLSNFQRVRGMLRLLAQTVAHLWQQQPTGIYAIHLHHLDPSFGPTHNEIVTRLELGAFDPAIRNDVASGGGDASLAESLDNKHYAGLAPYTSWVARSVLWHTFAFNESLKGATGEELLYAVLGPGLDPAFVNDARQRFVADSAYLDDRPGSPHRFLTEANLNLMIRRQEKRVDAAESRAQLRDRIRDIFSSSQLSLVLFPGGPYDVDDDVGDGRPKLVLVSYDAETVRLDQLRVPDLVEKIFRWQGTQGGFRQLQNHLVFLVADDSLRDEMKAKMDRRLALEALRGPDRLAQLPPHQQEKVQELYQRSAQELAIATQQCYRHLFFASRANRVEDATIDLGHTAFDVGSASDRPGIGQQQVLRALADNRKLLRPEDPPLAPTYVRDNTPLKKGQITTADLRAEFYKDPRLPIMLGNDNLVKLVQKGVNESVYVYRSGDLLFGPADPFAEIRIDPQSIVFTLGYAKEHGIWPRPAPPPPPPTGGSGGTGTVTGPVGPGPAMTGETPSPSLAARTFRAEAPLREALTQIWDDARRANVERIGTLTLRLFDPSDAFKLLSGIGAIPGANKHVSLQAAYETADGGNANLTFEGKPGDAVPVREFLEAQFRAARERDLTTTYQLTFAEGLPLDSEEPKGLTERLARFASGAAYVEATAEAVS